MTDTDAPRIVIVGGVAGRTSAAARARRMNAQPRIVVFARDAYISFANCSLPYCFGGEITDRDSRLVASPELFEGSASRFMFAARSSPSSARRAW